MHEHSQIIMFIINHNYSNQFISDRYFFVNQSKSKVNLRSFRVVLEKQIKR